MQSGFKIPDPNFSVTLPTEKSKYSYGKKMCPDPHCDTMSLCLWENPIVESMKFKRHVLQIDTHIKPKSLLEESLLSKAILTSIGRGYFQQWWYWRALGGSDICISSKG